MPNIPQQQTIVQYIANASQTQYTFAFYAPEQTDIQVFYQASNVTPNPSSQQLVLNTNYTVTYNSDPTTGGYITLLFTPMTGYYLTINLMIQASLNTNFANAQNFNGANLDAALDRLLMLCQQNQNYALERNLSYIINTYLPDATPFTQLPPLALNQVWIGGSAGVVAATISQVPSASVLQSLLANAAMGADGASLVGYYDTFYNTPTTVAAMLSLLAGIVLNNNIVPTGVILDFGGGSIPPGYLACDFSAVSRTTYANLFAAIGTTWGAGDGSTTFNVPGFARCVAVGSGGAGTSILGNTVGSNGGSETHTQLISEMPSHNHPPLTGTAFQEQGGTGTGYGSPGGAALDMTTGNTGGGNPFNIIQPSLVVTKIIKY